MELESSEKDDEDAEEDDDLPIVDLTQSEAHPIAKGSGGIIPKTAVRKVEVPTFIPRPHKTLQVRVIKSQFGVKASPPIP